ncbi:MAG: hypothetical protein HLUCCA08_08185 [Rhodobacteraceae bacterium HLUCCA08]|nr:MAG: hypothetical protein HLUCCA08_08185 [Rhodobacteraceae bacterium HLUCCA08]
MFRVLTLIAALVLAAPAARAQSDGIEAVIRAQLGAFTDRDEAGAFAYASPALQVYFGTPEVFGRMVRGGYPMVWDNADAQMLERREIAGRLWQKVLIEDAAGRIWVLDYAMIETAEGWRIDGVQILPAPDAGV